MDDHIGVLLFNLGGPGNLEEVEPFLRRLFSDRDIIELPLGAAVQPGFAWMLARLRASSVRRNYARIGGGSPQLAITRRQAKLLEERLNAEPAVSGRRFRTFVSMRYAAPSIADALTEMEAAGIRRVVTLSLFPQWSRATTGSWMRELERTLSLPRWRGAGFEISHIDQYPTDPGYLDALADTVRQALNRFPPEARPRVVLLFSAHGLPKALVDRGDPYVKQIDATRLGVLERLDLPNRELLGYQSRTGPVRWIGPGTDELIDELGAEGVERVVLVPLSFVSDHIETLYEIDLLFAERARRAGIREFVRSPALNEHPRFIEALARLVERHETANRLGRPDAELAHA